MQAAIDTLWPAALIPSLLLIYSVSDICTSIQNTLRTSCNHPDKLNTFLCTEPRVKTAWVGAWGGAWGFCCCLVGSGPPTDTLFTLALQPPWITSLGTKSKSHSTTIPEGIYSGN